jgi:hypothetical protein
MKEREMGFGEGVGVGGGGGEDEDVFMTWEVDVVVKEVSGIES